MEQPLNKKMIIMNRIFTASLAISLLTATAAMLNAGSNQKATGDAQWGNTSVGTQAHVVFNAIKISPNGFDAKGSLLYDDGTYVYTMDVKYLKVINNTAWFAGVVTASPGDQRCCAVGHWILYKVQDNGEPGINTDQFWGEDLGSVDSAVALGRVANGPDPIGGPFVINGGNVQVH
jgi:hypothetical protein